MFISRWGRGHPEEYTENMNLGEEGYDSMEDKKPRAGQILWIRGLTRLQTQVSDNVCQAFTHYNTMIINYKKIIIKYHTPQTYKHALQNFICHI